MICRQHKCVTLFSCILWKLKIILFSVLGCAQKLTDGSLVAYSSVYRYMNFNNWPGMTYRMKDYMYFPVRAIGMQDTGQYDCHNGTIQHVYIMSLISVCINVSFRSNWSVLSSDRYTYSLPWIINCLL